MQRRILASVAAVIVFGASAALAPARAETIVLDFQDIDVSAGTVGVPSPYQSQGFSLSSTSGGFAAYGPNSGFNYAGATGLAAFAPADIGLTRIGGGTFSLLSIDLARNFAFDDPPTVTFTGTLAGGGTISQMFTVTTPVGTQAFQTFTFTGFTDLVSVTWNQPGFPPPPGQGLHQFTDVTISVASVPEPSTLVLGMIGTVGSFCVVRRRRR
jgi:hypothetical protein